MTKTLKLKSVDIDKALADIEEAKKNQATSAVKDFFGEGGWGDFEVDYLSKSVLDVISTAEDPSEALKQHLISLRIEAVLSMAAENVNECHEPGVVFWYNPERLKEEDVAQIESFCQEQDGVELENINNQLVRVCLPEGGYVTSQMGGYLFLDTEKRMVSAKHIQVPIDGLVKIQSLGEAQASWQNWHLDPAGNSRYNSEE